MFTSKKQTGFTIVELLIVIVVIAVLAAISIVAYGGIQDRARTSAGRALAQDIVKKAEVYRQITDSYPRYVDLRSQTGPEEARLNDLYSTGSRPNPFNAAAADGGKRVAFWNYCYSDPPGGASVVYFDYTKKKQVVLPIGSQLPSGEVDEEQSINFSCS